MNCEHEDGVTLRKPPQSPHQLTVQQQQASDQRHAQRSTTPAKLKNSFAASLAKIKASSSASNKPGDCSRLPPRTQWNGRDLKPDNGKQSGKALVPVAGSQMPRRKLSGPRKLSERTNASDELTKESDCVPDKISPSDSSPELIDKFPDTSSNTESRGRGAGANRRSQEVCVDGPPVPDRDGTGDQQVNMSVGKDVTVSPGRETGQESLSPSDERSSASSDSRLSFRASFALSDLQEELIHGMQEQFVREIEELRSENDYLKDELEEAQAEVLEMRDAFLEEDALQLRALRQQLDQATRGCRILQYRLSKAQRRGLRAARTGHLDQDLVCTLQQDLKVAKGVAARLHGELEAVERRRAELEQENTGLRERLQELEVARQVLQAEWDRTRENSLKRKGSRSSLKSEKKLLPQEDSGDLRCQLHFAKEESTLMCRKLAQLARESEASAEELARFRSLYGRAEEGPAAGGRRDARAREAELRLHLQLVEEEAGLLSRRVVELEAENHGLRAKVEERQAANAAVQDDNPSPVDALDGDNSVGLKNQKGCWVDQPRWDRGLQTRLQHKQARQDGLLLLSLQLRCFLKHWRHGNGLEPEQRGRGFLEVNGVNGLHLLREEEGHAAHRGDGSSPSAGENPLPLDNHKHTLPLEKHTEVRGTEGTLLELKGVLQELTAEMLAERHASRDLAQKLSCAKSAWEAERTALLSPLLHQVLQGEKSEMDTDIGPEAKGADLHRIKHLSPSMHRRQAVGPRGQFGPLRSGRYQERADLYRTWAEPLSAGGLAGVDGVRRSHTAPERTGLRLYFSPPALRRAQRCPLEANLSDDMKERTLGRRWADAACQTAGRAGAVGVASVALQTEDPASSRPPRRPLSDPLERALGPPRSRTPKLQRRVSSSSQPLSTSSSTLTTPSASFCSSSSSVSSSSSSAALAGAPLWRSARGQSGSAWARGPRSGDGPGAGRGAGGRSDTRAGAGQKCGIVQEFFRSVCGRGQLPAAGGQGRGGAGGGAGARGKPERAAPRVPVPAGSDSVVTSVVNKRFLRHSLREEPGRGGGEKSGGGPALEDPACDCTSRSLASCFARPSRSGIPHAPGQCRLRSPKCCQSSRDRHSQPMSDATPGQSQQSSVPQP
ncbi:uncharacterized protein LOC133110127 [Conger conger]|uniref:uncharacterized protein LOC133110127 n=1 Tax=Conger conger TaxID=82655 RepID=UPI002A5A8342|nr:uncharacterized protein LOC133110127 [Conger conger]